MCIRQPFFMSLCTPKLPRIIVSKGNHMSQDTIIRRSPIRGSGRICKFYPFPGSPPRRELRAATHPKRATKTAFRKCKRRIERHFLGYLTAPISGSAADGPSFSSSSHANHFLAAGSYSPVRTISRAFSRISSHPVCRPSTVACTGISIRTPGVRVCGSSG